MNEYLAKSFEIEGKKYDLNVHSGVVIKCETRSDTYVSGSGRSSSYKGYGSGSTTISSKVVVTKEIWIRTASGSEQRYNMEDLAVNNGHIVHIGIVNGHNAILHNRTTNNSWFLDSMKNINSKNYGFLERIVLGLMGVGLLFGGIWALIGLAYLWVSNHGFLAMVIILSVVGGIVWYVRNLSVKSKQIKDAIGSNFFGLESNMAEVAAILKSPPQLQNSQNSQAELPKMFCSDCGKPVLRESAFCGGCGIKVAIA